MLSLLLKLKSYGIIALSIICLLFALYYHHQYSNAQLKILQQDKQLLIANEAIQAQNEAIERWKAAGDKLNERLRLTEQEAAKQRSESQKRVEDILSAKIPSGCENAIQWGIDQASTYLTKSY